MTPHTRCGWIWLLTHAGHGRSSFSFELLLPCMPHNFFFTSVIMFSFFHFSFEVHQLLEFLFVFCPFLLLAFEFLILSGFHIFTGLFVFFCREGWCWEGVFLSWYVSHSVSSFCGFHFSVVHVYGVACFLEFLVYWCLSVSIEQPRYFSGFCFVLMVGEGLLDWTFYDSSLHGLTSSSISCFFFFPLLSNCQRTLSLPFAHFLCRKLHVAKLCPFRWRLLLKWCL